MVSKKSCLKTEKSTGKKRRSKKITVQKTKKE